jgi:tetratricopeptide repeat protein
VKMTGRASRCWRWSERSLWSSFTPATEPNGFESVDYFITLGERAAPELNAGSQHVRWIDRLAREKHNLRAALFWCVEKGEVERGLQLGRAGWRYWFLTGSLPEVRDWLEALLRLLTRTKHSLLTARALNAAAVLTSHQGDYGTARGLHERSLQIARELQDHERIAESLHNLGMLAFLEATRDQRSGCSRKRSRSVARPAIVAEKRLARTCWVVCSPRVGNTKMLLLDTWRARVSTRSSEI